MATITSEEQLRAILGGPRAVVVSKITDRLNPMTRQFVERAPFLCLATCGADGSCDVSPRGDPPGFVRILDDRTLLIPDRPGNRIADSLRNIIETGQVALLFVIPGVDDSFRVNGRATLLDDADLLAPCAVAGKVPRFGIRVAIEAAYTQCAKAFLRSDLWNPGNHIARSTLPTQGEIMRAINGERFDADQYDIDRAKRYATGEGMY